MNLFQFWCKTITGSVVGGLIRSFDNLLDFHAIVVSVSLADILKVLKMAEILIIFVT